ncbi:MAG: agarase [Verrucomicrobiota bacterium]
MESGSYSRRDVNRLLGLAGLLGGSGLSQRMAWGGKSGGYFTVREFDGRHLFETPAGEPFFAISFNHIDSTAMRYPENLHLWQERYGSSEERWIKERVAPDLQAWGFNSIGWNQEVVLREPDYHWHTPNWTRDHYNWAGMPYFHNLPFLEAHRWKLERKWPDFYSKDFELWCDYVARENCAALADDKNLIGYYFADVPLLIDKSDRYPAKDSIHDPELMNTAAGRAKIAKDTRQYYQVACDAIRRYDPNHLIFGDRYNLGTPMPEPVIDAAAEFLDAIGIQLAGRFENISPTMSGWTERTGLPYIVADAVGTHKRDRLGVGYHVPAKYDFLLNAMREDRHCLGVNLCGGFVRNRTRLKGVYDEQENPDQNAIDGFIKTNGEIQEWYSRLK